MKSQAILICRKPSGGVFKRKTPASLKGGYAPEVLVLGKHTRLPGSVSSDTLLPAHMLAESEHAQGLKFRSQLAMRETARRAFHSADNGFVTATSIYSAGQILTGGFISLVNGSCLGAKAPANNQDIGKVP